MNLNLKIIIIAKIVANGIVDTFLKAVFRLRKKNTFLYIIFKYNRVAYDKLLLSENNSIYLAL